MRAPKQMRCDHAPHTVATSQITIRWARPCSGDLWTIVGVEPDGTEMTPGAIEAALKEALARVTYAPS